ncbi:MAG: hypothetical protein V1779_01060 [bacterium]
MNISKVEILKFIDNINFNQSNSLNEGIKEFQEIINKLFNKKSFDDIELIIIEFKYQNKKNEKLLKSLDDQNLLNPQGNKERFVLRGKISGIKSLLFLIQKELLNNDREDLFEKHFPIESKGDIKVKTTQIGETQDVIINLNYSFFKKNSEGKFVFNSDKAKSKKIDFKILASQLICINNTDSQSIITWLMRLNIFDFTDSNWKSMKTYIKRKEANKPKNQKIISEIESILKEYGDSFESFKNP